MVDPSGIKVSPRSTEDIRQLAIALRKLFEIGTGPVDVIRFLDHDLSRYDVEYYMLSKEELGSNHGLTYPDECIITLREDIYCGACDGNGRDRFTVAHEIGHLFLHRGLGFARNSAPTGPHHWYEDSEWQANTFAAEFLMPLDEIREYCKKPWDIMQRFGVSIDAARIRWKKLNKRGEI